MVFVDIARVDEIGVLILKIVSPVPFLCPGGLPEGQQLVSTDGRNQGSRSQVFDIHRLLISVIQRTDLEVPHVAQSHSRCEILPFRLFPVRANRNRDAIVRHWVRKLPE